MNISDTRYNFWLYKKTPVAFGRLPSKISIHKVIEEKTKHTTTTKTTHRYMQNLLTLLRMKVRQKKGLELALREVLIGSETSACSEHKYRAAKCRKWLIKLGYDK